MSILVAGYIGVIGIHSDKDLASVAILCGTFLTAGFTGKVMQKKSEESSQESILKKD